ncbi:MAG: hypothetical protein Ta2A_03650 [Treponemataceae bacterium]|nr:MAG: hypothetical protein Ta2A_03650 [Treponemataceae bacterium]
MNGIKKILSCKTVVFAAVVLVTCFCNLFAQTADLQALVRINITQPPETITLKQLKERLKMYQAQSSEPLTFTVKDKKQVLDALIEERLVLQAAKRDGVSVTDTQVNTQFVQAFAQQLGRADLTEAELQKLIKDSTGLSLNDYMVQAAGMSVNEYKAFLKNQLISQNYIIRGKENVMKQAVPTDADIRKYYDNHRSELTQPETLKLFLVVGTKMTDAAGVKRRITSVYDEIKKGSKDYAGIKKRYENDTASFVKAGEVYVGRTEQAARALGMTSDDLADFFSNPNGFVSEVTETEQTFQFFIILDRYQPKMLAISDVVEPESTVTIYEAIKSRLTQQKQQEFFLRESQDTVKKLRVASNYQMIKDGAELEKLLSW